MTGDTLITIQIWEETSALPDADPVTQTGARCSKCGFEVLVEGSGEDAVLKCVEALRRDCPFAEENRYVPFPGGWR
jgi:DNA-directed RNA polymerase subunit RPC12/RpoP